MLPSAPLPGVARPQRLRPRFHYELLVCGLRGHALVGTDAAALRERDGLYARHIDGVRWHRCLRCDGWLPLSAPAHPTRDLPPEREQIILPNRGRPLRDKIVLRSIAIDRAIHFLVLGALAFAIFFVASDEASLRHGFYAILGAIHGTVGGPTTDANGAFADRIDELLSLPPGKLHLIGLALGAYALIEGVEAVGLWLQKRWAEYLTLVATAVFLPLEIYELAHGVTPFKLIAFAINIAIVAYLLFAKRLFGLRGGAAAERQIRARDVGWQSLERSAPEAFGPAR